ncbi:uncharacterized protein METZ01_LOCUS130410 [marine metagenome]|uniref:Uncharacterized protein n=1 Tax=marine metagenome TaxID=408172 RepID=A0A381YKG8_9ZZZZ
MDGHGGVIFELYLACIGIIVYCFPYSVLVYIIVPTASKLEPPIMVYV